MLELKRTLRLFKGAAVSIIRECKQKASRFVITPIKVFSASRDPTKHILFHLMFYSYFSVTSAKKTPKPSNTISSWKGTCPALFCRPTKGKDSTSQPTITERPGDPAEYSVAVPSFRSFLLH